MAWTDIDEARFVDGHPLSGDDMQEILGNLNETAPNVARAVGDLFVASGRNAVARVPRPAAGEDVRYLGMSATDRAPSWRTLAAVASSNGWTPVFALESSGSRRVLRISDWTGGAGNKPATGYLAASGLVSTAAAALDIRGAPGTDGNPGRDGTDGNPGRDGTDGTPGSYERTIFRAAVGPPATPTAPASVADAGTNPTLPANWRASPPSPTGTQRIWAVLQRVARGSTAVSYTTPQAWSGPPGSGTGGGAGLSDRTPQATGTASAGTGTEASRDDHVHAAPDLSGKQDKLPALAEGQVWAGPDATPTGLPDGGQQGGQSKAQVATAIDAALDALAGDVEADLPRGQAVVYDESRSDTDDNTVLRRVISTSSNPVPRYTLTAAQKLLGSGGERFRVELTVRHHGTAYSGFDSYVDLEIDVNGVAAGTYRLHEDGPQDIAADIPASAYAAAAVNIDVSLRLSLRGTRARGTVTVDRAALVGTGSHEEELGRFVDARVEPEIDAVGNRLDAAAQSLQSRISDVANRLITARERRVLGLFELIQVQDATPYPLAYRYATSGNYRTPTASFTPTAASVQFRIAIADRGDAAGILLRQDDATGVPQDYLLTSGTGASGPAFFSWRLTFPNLNPISVLHLGQHDDLHVLQDVRDLLRRLDELDAHLQSDALALLDEVAREDIETTTVARTGTLSHLTTSRLAFTGDPLASPALAGGEFLLSLSADGDRTSGYPANSVTGILSAFLGASSLSLLQIQRAATGYAYLYAAYLLPARPASTVNSRVNLLNLTAGPGRQRQDSYDYALARNGVATDYLLQFMVDADVAAGTTATVTVAIEANADGNIHSYSQAVAIGGAASGAATSTRRVSHWDIHAQYVVAGTERRLRLYIVHPGGGLVPPPTDARVSAFYTAATAIPAAPERYAYGSLYGGLSVSRLTATLGLRVNAAGNIEYVLPPSSAGIVSVAGVYDSHIPASRFGLQAGGQGVLSTTAATAAYRTLLRVDSGALTPDNVRDLNPAAERREFELGLYTRTDADDRAFAFKRALKAPALFVGDQRVTPGGDGGAPAAPVTRREIVAPAFPFRTSDVGLALNANEFAIVVELRYKSSEIEQRHSIFILREQLPALNASKSYSDDTNNPPSPTGGRNVRMVATGTDTGWTLSVAPVYSSTDPGRGETSFAGIWALTGGRGTDIGTPDFPLSNDVPRAAGVARAGDGMAAARDDHVHPAELIPQPFDGTPRTALLGVGGPDSGSSELYARGDHRHGFPDLSHKQNKLPALAEGQVWSGPAATPTGLSDASTGGQYRDLGSFTLNSANEAQGTALRWGVRYQDSGIAVPNTDWLLVSPANIVVDFGDPGAYLTTGARAWYRIRVSELQVKAQSGTPPAYPRPVTDLEAVDGPAIPLPAIAGRRQTGWLNLARSAGGNLLVGAVHWADALGSAFRVDARVHSDRGRAGSAGGGASLSNNVPAAASGTGAAGAADTASRSDHVHPAGPGGGGQVAFANTDPLPPGTAASGDDDAAARGDHVHPAETGGPWTSQPARSTSSTGSAGSSNKWARGDHRHPHPSGATFFLHLMAQRGTRSEPLAVVQSDFYGDAGNGLAFLENRGPYGEFDIGLPTSMNLAAGDVVRAQLIMLAIDGQRTSSLSGWTAASPTEIGEAAYIEAAIDSLGVNDPLPSNPADADFAQFYRSGYTWASGSGTVSWCLFGSLGRPKLRFRVRPMPLSNTRGAGNGIVFLVPWIMVGKGASPSGTALTYDMD